MPTWGSDRPRLPGEREQHKNYRNGGGKYTLSGKGDVGTLNKPPRVPITKLDLDKGIDKKKEKPRNNGNSK